MNDGPSISRIATLIGHPTRSNMLLSLMDGRALTATELANVSGVTKQTASSHLAQLLDGQLVSKETQGRHHYYRLKDHNVADAIEVLLCVADNGIGKRTRTGPREPALRKARICYDHLAGDLGVFMFDRMISQGWIEECSVSLQFTDKGWSGLEELHLTIEQLPKSRRPICKSCLDWSERRHHLAGKMGAVILTRLLEKKWAIRLSESRIIQFSKPGEAAFISWLS